MLKSSSGSCFIIYLSLLSMLGFLSTDIYLPAFSALEASLNSSPNMIAASLSLFVVGVALGQLFFGQLAQKSGNRFALLVGLGLFLVASSFLAYVETDVALIAGRLIQGFGVSSAGVIWQSLVIERFDEKESQRVFSIVMPLVALSPALAPVLGAYILESSGWCSIFVSLSILALFMFLITLQLKECKACLHKKHHEPRSEITIKDLLQHPVYLGNALMFGGMGGVFFGYLTLWPTIMESFGYSPEQLGQSFIPQTLMFMFGGFLSARLVRTHGASKTQTILMTVMLLSIATIVVFNVFLEPTSVFSLLIPFCFVAMANGGLYPIVVNQALQVFPEYSARASGLQNFIQSVMNATASGLAAYFAATAAFSASMVMCLFLSIVLYGLFLQRKGLMLSDASELSKQLV